MNCATALESDKNMQSRELEAHLYKNSSSCLKSLCNVSILPTEYILYCEHCKVAFLDAKLGSEYIHFEDASGVFFS